MAHSTFKKLAVALALVSAFGAASASPVLHDLGTLTNTLTFSRPVISGAFDDVLYFKAATLQGAIGSIVGLDGGGDLTGMYRFGMGDSFNTVAWYGANTLSPAADVDFSYSKNFPTLQAGQTYWFEIQGSMSEGLYTARIAPTLVPEPGSIALVLAGLGMMGAVARRRRAVN